MTKEENLERQFFASIAEKMVDEKYVRLAIDAFKACPQVITTNTANVDFFKAIIEGAKILMCYISDSDADSD
jgi:hypothetical protein